MVSQLGKSLQSVLDKIDLWLVGNVRADLANSEQNGNEKAESAAGLKEGSVG